MSAAFTGFTDLPALTSNGVLGDPRAASSEKGEDYFERFADLIVSEIDARPVG